MKKNKNKKKQRVQSWESPGRAAPFASWNRSQAKYLTCYCWSGILLLSIKK